ncbi:hypothetical protein OAW57_01110, partial [Flavobacteriales bacterium]|nr:hypothetical protein [Flavobacteriales bacterium]
CSNLLSLDVWLRLPLLQEATNTGVSSPWMQMGMAMLKYLLGQNSAALICLATYWAKLPVAMI